MPLSPDYLANLGTGPKTNVTWPVYTNKSAANIVFHLNGTHLEPDTWRLNAIGRLLDSLHEFKI